MARVERTATRIVGFESSEMDFQLMRMLGAATAGGSTPGEIFAARAAIPGDAPYTWPSAFAARAAALERAAADARKRNHGSTAAGHLLRASSYYRSAEYFSDPFGEEARKFGLASRSAFIAAAASQAHDIEPVDIAFEGVDLPGYFMRPAAALATAGRLSSSPASTAPGRNCTSRRRPRRWRAGIMC